MCIEVFLGCDAVLAVESTDPPAPRFGVFAFPERAEPLRAILGLPNLYYVGAHTGCGCGFNSGDIGWQVSSVTEAVELLDAMTTDERQGFVHEQRSREQLATLIQEARNKGRVVLYSCWWGDEALPLQEEKTVAPDYFARTLEPLEERTLFRLA